MFYEIELNKKWKPICVEKNSGFAQLFSLQSDSFYEHNFMSYTKINFNKLNYKIAPFKVETDFIIVCGNTTMIL